MGEFDVNKRVKKIMENENLTQAKFGDILGVSRSVIANIVYERTEPNNLFLNHLCATFNVNKEWLETGIGNMYKDDSEDLKLASIMGEILADNENEELKSMILTFHKLTKEQRGYLLKLMQDLTKSNKKDAF